MTPRARRLVVYYDAWCPTCRRIRATVERLDWLGLVEFQSLRDPAVEAASGVPAALLAARMHARAGSGRTVSGAAAFAALAARVPLLAPLWLPLVVAVRLGVGERAYDAIARRRLVVPVGTCVSDGGGACALPAAADGTARLT